MTGLLKFKPDCSADDWTAGTEASMTTAWGREDVYALEGPPKRNKRRMRTNFSNRDLSVLENAFAKNPYPDVTMRENLADELGVEEARIHTWFQNKRSRQKRAMKSPTTTSPRSSPEDSGHSRRKSRRPLPADLHSPASSTDSSSATWAPRKPAFKRPWCDDDGGVDDVAVRSNKVPKRSSMHTRARQYEDSDEPLDLSLSGSQRRRHRPRPLELPFPSMMMTSAGVVPPPSPPHALPLCLYPYMRGVLPVSPGLSPLTLSPSLTNVSPTVFQFPTQRFVFPTLPPSASPQYKTTDSHDESGVSSDVDTSGYASQVSPDGRPSPN